MNPSKEDLAKIAEYRKEWNDANKKDLSTDTIEMIETGFALVDKHKRGESISYADMRAVSEGLKTLNHATLPVCRAAFAKLKSTT